MLEFESAAFSYRSENPAQKVHDGFIVTSSFLSIKHSIENAEFYRHGWHSWSPTSWLAVDKPPLIVEPPSRRLQCDDRSFSLSTKHNGSGVGAVRARDLPGTTFRKSLFIGALDLCARIDTTKSEMTASFTDGVAGRFFVCFENFEEACQRYSRRLAERFGTRPVATKNNIWCSWYSFGQQISEDSLGAILSQTGGYNYQVFQIDDGWQKDIGDWEENDNFKSGMKNFSSKIIQAGLVPGLWLSPLLVKPSSDLFKENPNWILKDSKGEFLQAGFNWGTPTYALDAQLPAVQDWLVALLERVINWGYSYLKLDFMYAGALRDRGNHIFSDENLYRNTLRLVRSAVGEQTYLLLCGSPILPSLGIADGLRIGPDVAPYWDKEERSVLMHDRSWPSCKNAIRTCAHRLWLRSLVDCDTDVVYFRSRYNLLKPHELQLLQQLSKITKFKGTSDPIDWLLDCEKDRLKQFFDESSTVEHVGEFVYLIDGNRVDFEEVF